MLQLFLKSRGKGILPFEYIAVLTEGDSQISHGLIGIRACPKNASHRI